MLGFENGDSTFGASVTQTQVPSAPLCLASEWILLGFFSLNMKGKIKSKSCVGDNWMINSLSPQRADKQHPLYLSSDGLLLLIHLSPRLTLQGFQNVGKCPLEVLSPVLL